MVNNKRKLEHNRFVSTLRQYLENKHGAKKELAEKAGISQSLLSEILSGKTHGGLEKRKKLATAMGFNSYDEAIEQAQETQSEQEQNNYNLGEKKDISSFKAGKRDVWQDCLECQKACAQCRKEYEEKINILYEQQRVLSEKYLFEILKLVKNNLVDMQVIKSK